MKRMLWASALLLLLSLNSAEAETPGSSWKVVYPEYPPASEYSIKDIIDLQEGKFLVVTKSGSFKTADSGSTWKFVDTDLVDVPSGVYFLNSNTGWLWSSREIAFTNDGGNRWSKLSSLPWNDRPVVQGLFLDERIGFLRSLYGDLLRTEDGGKHWNKIQSLPATSQSGARTIHFSNTSTGILTSDAEVYKTEDAGLTWKKFHQGETKIRSACYNGKYGIVIEEYGDTFYTADSGRSWREGEIKPYDGLADIQFTSDCQALGSSEKGLLYISNDRGKTWQTRDLRLKVQEQAKGRDSKPAVRKILREQQFGFGSFALLGYGFILKTSDNGSTWSSVRLPRDIFTSSSCGNRIYGLSDPNSIAYSADLGGSWKKILSANENVIAAVLPDNKTGYAVTNNGTVLKKTAMTGSWQPVSELFVPDERIVSAASLLFVNEKDGLLFINSRYIYRTVDGGKGWAQVFDLNDSHYPEVYKVYNNHFESKLTLRYNQPGVIEISNHSGFFASMDSKTRKVSVIKTGLEELKCDPVVRPQVWENNQRGWSMVADDNDPPTLSFWEIDKQGSACRKLSLFPTKGYVKSITVDGKNIIVATVTPSHEKKNHVSVNGGLTWIEIKPKGGMSELVSLSVKGAGTDLIALDNSNRLWTSADRGISWMGQTLAAYKANKRLMMHGSNRWIDGSWVSSDKGRTWLHGPAICNNEQYDMLLWNENVTSETLLRSFGPCRKEIRQYKNMRGFVFPNRSILVDDEGQVYHLKDDSSSFTRVGALYDVSGAKKGPRTEIGQVSFADQDHGCAFGMFSKEEWIAANGIFCTKDGGKSWRKADVEKADDDTLASLDKENGAGRMPARLLAAFTGFKGVMNAAFQLVDARNGWAVVTTVARKAYLVRTTDGGSRWKQVAELNFLYAEDNQRFMSEIKFVGFLNENRGCIGGSSFLFITDDGGKTFRRELFSQRFGSNLQLLVEHKKTYLVTENAVLEYVGLPKQAATEMLPTTMETTDGSMIAGIEIDKSTAADVSARFGNKFVLKKHGDYSYEMQYSPRGISFYYLSNDAGQKIFGIHATPPYLLRTTMGITLNQSTMEDVRRVYGSLKWSSSKGSDYWYSRHGAILYGVFRDKDVPQFPMEESRHVTRKIVSIDLDSKYKNMTSVR